MDDGWIHLVASDREMLEWQEEIPFAGWNVYRGDGAAMRATGVYTQTIGSNPYAARFCGLVSAWAVDPVVPSPGDWAFYLVSGIDGAGGEGSLGTDAAGVGRPLTHACP